MLDLIYSVPIVPLLGFLVLAIFGAFLPKRIAGAIGAGSVGVSFILAALSAGAFLSRYGSGGSIDLAPVTWMNVGGMRVDFGVHLDALALVMTGVVTFVGFWIHLYATQSMADEDGYSRFFACMNLFVFFMLTLVLANNLVLLYLGWEGVGLCSYLLIGFWYKDRSNGLAAQKAFIVTRVGDTALAVGLFLLFVTLGTFDISSINSQAAGALAAQTAAVIGLLILGGAVGKSAQIPLQVWLPDAMAGPTPVSALIHAATMVTAGVYLIARLHPIFLLAPATLTVVGLVGAVTALYAAFSALAQSDVKRVLAYSTISQIGYMFLALGVGAWSAAIFHLFTHAFFKALLFLSAGVASDALHHELNMFKMGGLAKKLPTAYRGFLIGAASLSSLPLVTSGFFSKDEIIWYAWASRFGGSSFAILALLTAFLTAIYAFRALFLTFLGPEKHKIDKYPRISMNISLWVLAFFSITAGWLGIPPILGGTNRFEHFLEHVFPGTPLSPIRATHTFELIILLVSMALFFGGFYLSWLYYQRRGQWAGSMAWASVGVVLRNYFQHGWGFDWLYTRLFVWPYVGIAHWNRRDILDHFFTGISWAAVGINRALSSTQNGHVRGYVAGLVSGAILCIAFLLYR